MQGAPCPHCGQQVMPFRRFAVHLASSAPCQSCALPVRIRGYYHSLAGGIFVALAVIVLFVMRPDMSLEHSLLILLALALVGFLIDYSMWRWLGYAALPTIESTADGTASSRLS